MNSQKELFSTLPPDKPLLPVTTGSAERKIICQLTIPGRLPSWNQVLGMEHWARYQMKQRWEDAFLSVLRAYAKDCSMRTISVKNFWSIAADALDLYRETARAKRRLKSASRKQSRELAKKSLFKSSKSEPPF